MATGVRLVTPQVGTAHVSPITAHPQSGLANAISYRLSLGVATLLASFSGPVVRVAPPKVLFLGAHALLIAGTILLAFGDSPEKYWPFVFPGLAIGSARAMFMYTLARYSMAHSLTMVEAETITIVVSQRRHMSERPIRYGRGRRCGVQFGN